VYFLADAREIDVFFMYCSNASHIVGDDSALRLIPLPAELDVAATFGLTVLSLGSVEANRLAFTILSPSGQRILARHGFEAPLLAPASA
jgi:molybdate transport system substrate-binding protein